MQKTKKQLNAYYFILTQILDRFSINKKQDKKILHNTFKEWYAREHQTKAKSLKDYSTLELSQLIDRILIEFSVEYGVFLNQPNDPNNAEDLSLSEYLEYKNWLLIDDMEPFEGVKSIPDTFTLVEDIKALKRLKPGKRSWNYPENIELKFGELIYLKSFREDCYYQKILSKFTPIDKLEEYINLKIVYAEQ